MIFNIRNRIIKINIKKSYLLFKNKLALSIATACLTACSLNDPLYSQKIGSVRSDFAGEEIVGVWTSAQTPGYDDSGQRITLLIRPDGTGVYKYFFLMRPDDTYLYNLTWSYSGNGIWNVTSKDVSDHYIKQIDTSATIRFTGNEILYETAPQLGISGRDVFTRPKL